MNNRAEILSGSQTEILSLQGFKPANALAQNDFGLESIAHSFPDATFPLSSLHEFTCNTKEECAATSAFIAGLLSSSLKQSGIALWIGTKRNIFPPALARFGINADQIIFIELKKERDAVWTIEEALKCTTVKNVVGEVAELDFTQSRRLQLAIEKSGVGCFLLRHNPRNVTTASTSRWNIKPLPSKGQSDMPGVSYPRWKVNLLKVRNGRPGSWVIEWAAGQFRHSSKIVAIHGEASQIKVG